MPLTKFIQLNTVTVFVSVVGFAVVGFVLCTLVKIALFDLGFFPFFVHVERCFTVKIFLFPFSFSLLYVDLVHFFFYKGFCTYSTCVAFWVATKQEYLHCSPVSQPKLRYCIFLWTRVSGSTELKIRSRYWDGISVRFVAISLAF